MQKSSRQANHVTVLQHCIVCCTCCGALWRQPVLFSHVRPLGLPHRVVLSRPASTRRVVTSCLNASCCHVLPHCVVLSRPASTRRVVTSSSPRGVVTSCLKASCCHVPPHRIVLSRPASPRRVVTSSSPRCVVTSCLTVSSFVVVGYGWLQS